MDTSAEQLVPSTNGELDANANTRQLGNKAKTPPEDQSRRHAPEAVIAHSPVIGVSQVAETWQEPSATCSAVISLQPQQECAQNDVRLEGSNEMPSLSSSSASAPTSSSSSSMSSTTSESSTSCCTCNLLKSCCIRCEDCLVRNCVMDWDVPRVRVAKYLVVPYILLSAIPISAVVLGLPGPDICPLITRKTDIGIMIFTIGLFTSICLTAKVIELLLECIIGKPRYFFEKGLEVVLYAIICIYLLIETVNFLRLPPPSSDTKSHNYCVLWYYAYVNWLNLGSFIILFLMAAMHLMKCFYTNDRIPPPVININGAPFDALPARIEI